MNDGSIQSYEFARPGGQQLTLLADLGLHEREL